MRGRDVGLPGYNSVRASMGLAKKTSWSQVTTSARVQNYLNEVYGPNPDDCDAYVCGLAESTLSLFRSSKLLILKDILSGHPGTSSLGELFGALIYKQFTNIRNGDRFWFERSTQFSDDEISTTFQ